MYYDYIIAGLRLRSDIDLVAVGIRGFKPFVAEVTGEADCVVTHNPAMDIATLGECHELATSYVSEADADSSFGRTTAGYLYSIQRRRPDSPVTYFYIDRDSGHVTTNIETADNIDISILRFGIWVMFGVVMASRGAIAIHSSTIVADGRAILFLGESGTGKSTHTRLWRENIEGARLLNDDSPIIRVINGELRVYGSPWSGKTPCYKNESYPIAGFCRLAQAPYNKIDRLPTIMAIGALLPSCPPIFAHDEYLQDYICKSIGEAIRLAPAYRLECLPNSAAAELSHATIIKGE